ncbi:MAG: hypothetical protein ABFD08_15235 [Syntrophomonas sp.]
MQNQIDIDRMKAGIQALREKLLAEKDKKFECDLELGLSGALSVYVSYKIRLAEIGVELEGISEIEKALADYEIVLQQEMKVLKAAQAKRRKQAINLVNKLDGMDYPETSLTLAQIASLIGGEF